MTARIGQPLNKKKKQTKKSAKNNAENRCHDNSNAMKARRKSNLVGKFRKRSEVRKVLLEQNHRYLPLDPMQWSREDVTVWLRIMSKRHDLNVDLELFMMNGKGLCLMSSEGFKYRCTEGGALLHLDLRKRLLTRIFIKSKRPAAL